MTKCSLVPENSENRKINESWTSFNCENLNDDFDSIIQKLSDIRLDSASTVLRIKVITSTASDTNELCSINIKKLQQKCKNKSIVIFVASKDDQKFLIYWKSKDVRQVLFLSSYKYSFSEHDKDVCEFAADFLVTSLNCGHLGISPDHDLSSIKGKVELHSLVDSRNYNLLLIAAESGKVKPIQMLLKYGIESQLPGSEITAQSLAYEGRHFDVLLELFQSNLPYPPQIQVNKCSEKLKSFIQASEAFHRMIKEQNKGRLDEIIQQYPNLQYFYNLLNESALKVALELDLIKIYELLISKRLSFAAHEDVDLIINGLSTENRELISLIHKKQSKDLPENHMTILMANTCVIQEESDDTGIKDLVDQIYKEFNKDPRLKVILKSVAATKIFKIVFNFRRDSAFDLQASLVSSQTSHRIDIPAKDLLNINTKYKVYGTVAHELCHYALYAVYGNKSNPYSKLDREAEKKFHKILVTCKQHKDREELIKNVYKNYEKNEQPAALIVKPAQLLAMYIHQPEKLQGVIGIFPELFSHFEEVISKMEQAVPEIEGRCSRKPLYVFCKLSDKNKMKVQGGLAIFMNAKVKLSELFSENPAIFELLTSDHILKLLKNEVLNFDDQQFGYLEELVELKWGTMPEILRIKVLNAEVNFQGQVVKLKELYGLYPEAFDELTSRELLNALSGDGLSIGGKEQLQVVDNFYVDRKFIPNDVGLIYFEYESKFEGADSQFNLQESDKGIRSFQEYYHRFLKQDFENCRQSLETIKVNPNFKASDFYLNDDQFTFLHKNSNEIIEQAEKARILVLASETGAGKTSTFKHLMSEVKKAYPTKWVCYVDLMDLVKVWGAPNFEIESFSMNLNIESKGIEETQERNLENSSENSGKFVENFKVGADPFLKSSTTSLPLESIEQILQQYLNFNSEISRFEFKMFQECLKSGSLVLFWDHIDYVPSSLKQCCLNFIKLLNKNVQFVSTVPSNSEKLCESLKLRTWQLLPFTEDCKREFLTKHFISKSILISEVEENVAKVEELMQSFNSNETFVYDFDTPVALQLLSVTDENGKIFNYSQVYLTFDAFVHHKIEDWMKSISGCLSTPDLMDSVKITFRKYALLNELSIFSSTTLGLKMRKLQIFQKPVPQIEEISHLKILIFNGQNNFKFFHKSISEFFVAQYFIENVLNVNGYVDIIEAELRLELFYHLMQNYGNLQQAITDFMSSYLNVRDSIKKKFNPTISILLRTKFKNFFIRLLDTNHAKIFEFLFEFFKSDHSLLVDLLHVYEDETLYTASFDPNYFGLMVDPGKIRELGEQCLTDEEFECFVNGKNQRGKIMFGEYFYSLLGVVKSYEVYGSKFEDTSLVQWHNTGAIASLESPSKPNFDEQSRKIFHTQSDTSLSTIYWKFLHKHLKPQTFMQKLFTNAQDDPLTESDQKQLFMTAISPKIYLFYDKIFSTAEFVEYKKLWTNFENLLNKSEMQEAIGSAMMAYFEICPDNKDGHDKFLYLLLKRAKKFLTNSQMYEIFMSRSILHESFWDSGNFKILWTFLSERTTKDERKQLLLLDDLGDQNFYFFSLLNESKDRFSSHKFAYYFYDFTALKVIHRTMTTGNAPAFECVAEIYEKFFNKNEIQEIILSSTDFMLYLIGKSSENSCGKFVNYLEKLFKGSENLLMEFLDRKVQPTNLTIFEFIEDFKGLEGTKLKWFVNLKLLSDLYEKLKANKM